MAQISYGTITVTDVTDGANANIWTTTVAPTTPNYTFTISNLTGSEDEPRVGDVILYGVYRYTITSINGTTVVAGNRQSLQGASGAPGGKWYTGTNITGTSTSPTIFSGSGISNAVVGDMYLNTATDNVYQCTVAGNASTAKWIYTGNIKGNPGNQGRSVTKVETEYYRKNSGGADPTASTTGSTSIPDYVDGCTYYTRTVTYFDSGNPDKGNWVKSDTLTQEIKNAYDAWIAAGAAELRTQKIINNSTGVTVAAGVNGGTVDEDNPSTYGYNTHLDPNYLGLRYNTINLAKLTTTETVPALEFYIPTINSSKVPVQGKKGLSITSSALTFYNPTDTSANPTPQLIIGADGALQSGTYSRGTDPKFSASGSKIDLVNGDIITRYFRVSQGLESGVTAGAYIHGTIEATQGKIGADSEYYWEIGEYTDYKNKTNATIIGHGGSFIQLGDSNNWRLSTNRIHSGWYTSGDTVLHYPQDSNNKYWDYGIHIPDSDNPAGRGSDKFLYIRTQNAANNSLENLLYDLDDNYDTQQWEYRFWIDRSGNVHAPAYYIGNEPLNGGTSSIAGKIINADSTYGKGSATHPIYLDTNGRPATTTYALNAAGAKGVVTDLANHTTSTDLPTAATVVSYITSRGYITSYTDNKVQTDLASNNSTFYIAGPTTTATNTGTLKIITDAKITVDTSGKATITATTFSGTASRATADGDGNVIKTTYLKLSGGQVTGPVSFGDSVTMDELTTGTLVVNGGASFTNNAQFNTINGVTVGSSPKFTDSEVSVLTLASGNNAGTSLTFGGKFTLTAGSKSVSFTMPTAPSSPVTSVNGKTGAVTLTASDVSATLVKIVRW